MMQNNICFAAAVKEGPLSPHLAEISLQQSGEFVSKLRTDEVPPHADQNSHH